ncbi:MAG: ABC transporter permease [Actinobacteria bacterium]|nr:ABC transporter permease [Actinomycetota bacterium]
MSTATTTAPEQTAPGPFAQPRRRRRLRGSGRLSDVLAPLVLFLVLGALWEWVAYHNRSLIPPIESVVADMADRPDYYAAQLWETLQSALIGLVIGVSAGIVLAIGIVHVRFLRSAVMPIALLINVTPIVAISPALIVAFGFTRTPHIIVVTLGVFFPMLINATAGLRAVDPQAMEVFSVMSASKLDVLTRLRFPTSVPYLFAGLRTSASMAMLGAIISEFTGTNKGLGASITLAMSYLNLSQLWGAIFLSALTSMALLGIVALAERLTVRW